ncbi:MAG: AmmeMemoRadiSam system protein B [Chloroflexi bacterium]|nr:AmmeMemoRadiSam system protein B [Chloroflexota bacterium]
MNIQPDIRPSPIAGQWYSEDPADLSDQIDHFLGNAQLPDLGGEIIAVIAPHAGHLYSGPVAGYAFRGVMGQHFDLVAVVAPMHRYHPQPLLTSGHSGYSTPLGVLPIAQEEVEALDIALQSELGVGLTAVRRDAEHSLEIELPFLQRALSGKFLLLPVMVREQAASMMQGLGSALAKTLRGRKALLVASTDLSHFYPQRLAEILDTRTLECIESFSPEDLYQLVEDGEGAACGLGPVAAVLWAAKELGGQTVRVLHHATSGDVTGDYSSVVGYGAAVVLKPK